MVNKIYAVNAETVPWEKTAVVCKDRKKIKGTYLLELVHQAVKQVKKEVLKDTPLNERELDVYEIDPDSENDALILGGPQIKRGDDWLAGITQWPIEKWTPIKREVTIYGNKFHLKGGPNNPRLCFKDDNSDLSYNEIYEKIKSVCKKCNITKSKFAKLQLAALRGNDYVYKKHKDAPKKLLKCLHFLNALMFGVEGSYMQPEATRAIGLMTLDLIANKKMKYKDALKGSTDTKPLGGAYPYAIWTKDAPAKRDVRDDVLQESIASKEMQIRLKKYRKNPKKCPILLKEVVLIRQWLVANDFVKTTRNKNKQVKAITKSVTDLVRKYFKK
jgi:hypothetical protein